MMTRIASALAALSLVACTGSGTLEQDDTPKGPSAGEVATAYLDSLAPVLVGRVMSAEERTWIEERAAEGMSAPEMVRSALSTWVDEPFLAETARDMVQNLLAVSGKRDDINFELPGNLARHVVGQKLPWSQILTADYCVGDDLSQIECDTGAPFSAGVLATRAYLVSRASRFNLTRASTMMGAFACQHYPLSEELEPRLPRERLITMFQADTPEDQEDPDAADAFGNGFACYSCHGQFSAHAQFFVRFDESGMYRADATGIQDPEGELGRSTGGLFASHLADPEEAKIGRSQMLGQQAENLAQGAAILGESQAFLECMASNVVDYALGLDERSPVPGPLRTDIASAMPADPTFQQIVVESLSHPVIIESATAYLSGETDAPTDTETDTDTETEQ